MSEQSPSKALADFAKRYELNARALSSICGGSAVGVSKSTADRVIRGVNGVRLTPERRITVANHMRDFLSRRGLSADAINKEIKTIFPEDNIMIISRATLPFNVQQFFGLRRDPFDP